MDHFNNRTEVGKTYYIFDFYGHDKVDKYTVIAKSSLKENIWVAERQRHVLSKDDFGPEVKLCYVGEYHFRDYYNNTDFLKKITEEEYKMMVLK